MKKTITLSIAALSFLIANAQLPVSQVAGKKQVLIEEFTGNKCGWCPTGHQIVDGLMSSNPGKVFGINLHPDLGATSLTYPSSAANGKDLRVPSAYNVVAIPTMIAAAGSGSIGLPAGTVNRMVPISPAGPQNAGGLLMDRTYWSGMTTTVLAQNSYVNIAGEGTYNPVTRSMSVNIQAYYTANSAVSANRISVALIQNNILGDQSSGSSYPAMWTSPNYKHNHALRDFLNTGSPNSARGEVMTGANTAGSSWSKTFTFTVPASYGTVSGKTIPAVLADLKVIAFITETDKNVVAVCNVPLTSSTTSDIVGPVADLLSLVSVYPNPMANVGAVVFTLSQESPVVIEVVNELGQTVISHDMTTLSQGEHKYEMDVTNLVNGIYLVNVKAGERTITQKVSVLK